MNAFLLIRQQAGAVVDGDGVTAPHVRADNAVADAMQVDDDRRELQRLVLIELKRVRRAVDRLREFRIEHALPLR